MIVIQVVELYLLCLQFLLITDRKMEQEMDRQCGVVAATVSDHCKELSMSTSTMSLSPTYSHELCVVNKKKSHRYKWLSRLS